MTVTNLGKKLGEWAALLAIIGVVGSLWVDREVERRMGELLPDTSESPSVVTLEAEMASVKDGQIRIERKVDDFSSKFLEYLERQAE